MSADITALIVEVKSVGIKDASNQLSGLSTSASNATKRVEAFMLSMQKLNTANVNATTSMDAYMARLREQATLLQNMRASTSATATSTKSLAEAMVLLSNSLNVLNQNTVRVDVSQRRHNESMREAHALARGLSGSMGALWLTYGNFAGMAVGVAIGASLKGIVAVGAEIEHTLETIRVLGETSTQDIVKMRDTIISLGQGSQGPKEVSLALSTLTLAGLSASESMKGVGAALDLAVVGGIGVEKAAYSLVQVSTALGYTAEGFSRVADVIAKTAAVSMSSVDSISGAFKSAASVGELYGASLVDIGVGLAALSNLGIQGTAAGTALKNFYKDLAAGSEKSKQTFADMKMSLESLRDADGFFLPLIDVIKRLDEGLGTLEGKSRQDALGKLLGERGVKEATALVKMLHTVSTEVDEFGRTYANKLEEVNDRVNKSYAFAALGAIAMAQTSQNQMKSVVNTLQTVFLKAFQEVSPQIGEVSRGLKAAFNSPEFFSAIKTTATLVADLTKFLVDHADVIGTVVKAYLAFKAIGVAAAIIKIGLAFDVAAISARLFSVALGPIGIAIVALTMAWSAYKNMKEDATQDKSSINSLSEQVEAQKELDEKLKKTLEMKRKGMSAEQIAKDEQYAKDKAAIDKGIRDSTDSVNAMSQDVAAKIALLTDLEKKQLAVAGNRRRGDGSSNMGGAILSPEVEAVIEAQGRLNESREKHLQNVKDADKYTRSIYATAKATAILDDEAAKAGRVHPTGDGELSGKVDKAGVNDSYSQSLLEVQGRIDSVKRQLKFAEEDLQSKYKQGLIGEIALIKEKEAVEVAAAKKTVTLLQEKLERSAGNENKKAVSQEIANAIQARTEVEIEAARNSKNKQAEYYNQLAEDTLKTDAKTYAARGEHVKAFMALSENKHKEDNDRLLSNYEQADNAEQRSAILKKINAEQAAFDAGVQSAAVKESVSEFEKLNAEMVNVFKGVQTASEGEGIAEMFEAASNASETYRKSLAKLKDAQENIAKAGNGGSLEDQTKADEAMTKLTGLAEKQRTMWAGVGESISKSLSNAFGDAGKAAGDFLMVSVRTSQTQEKIEANRVAAVEKANKSQKSAGDIAEDVGRINIAYAEKERSTRIKSYGDMAGAAKGFFKEGSTGYKVMEGAEKAFRIIELAGMAKSLATTIADAATKAVAYIPTFLMAWGSLGPWGLAAGAVAIAAILGSAGGGGGGGMSSADRQEKQGTGSVLGDDKAKSASIANSLSIIEKDSGLGLVHFSSMDNSLKQLVTGISGLSSVLLRTTGLADTLNTKSPSSGGFIGAIGNALFGGKKTVEDTGISVASGNYGDVAKNGVKVSSYVNTKEDGGWFSSDSYNTEMKALGKTVDKQFSLIILDIGNSIKGAATSMGLAGTDFADKLNSAKVEVDKISLKGLTGAEQQKELEAVLSKAADQLAVGLIPQLNDFANVGEGAFETLTRLANNLTQVSDVFSVMGQTMNVTGMDAVKLSEAFVTTAGGIDKLTEGAKFLVDNFFTTAEKMAPVTASVDKEMSRLEVSSVKTVEQFSELVHGLDLNTASGQDMFAALVKVAPAFKESADYAFDLAHGTVALTKAQQWAKDIADKQRTLDINLMSASGDSVGALAATREDELKALTLLSPVLAEIQQKIYKAGDAFAISTKSRSLEIALLTAQGNSLGALNLTREDELAALEKLSPALADRQKKIYAAADGQVVANKYISISNDLLTAQGKTQMVVNSTRAEELLALEAISPELAKLKSDFYALTDATAKANKARAMEISLMEALGGAQASLTARRNDELKNLSTADQASQNTIYAAQDRATTANKDFAVLSAAVQKAKDKAKDVFDDAVKDIESRKDAAQDAHTATVNASKAAVDASKVVIESAKDKITAQKESNKVIDKLATTLRSTLDSMLENTELAMTRSTAKAILAQTLATYKQTGKLPEADSLKEVLTTIKKPSDTLFSNYSDYIKDLNTTYIQMSDLTLAAEGTKSLADKQLEVLEDSLKKLEATKTANEGSLDVAKTALDNQVKGFDAEKEAAQKVYDDEVARHTTVLEMAQKQLNAMLGTQVAVESIPNALAAFNNSVSAAINAQQNANIGITPPQSATEEEIKKIYKTMLGREPDAEGYAWWVNAAKNGASASEIANGFLHSDEYARINGSHANGLDEVPFDGYTAKLHKGEMVLPAKQAQSVRDGGDMADIVKAIESLKEDNSAENQSLVSNIVWLKKLFQNMTPDGDRLQTNDVGAAV